MRIVTILLIGTLLITGCTRAQSTPSAAKIKIEIIDAAEEWRPSTVTIAAGGIVTWTNTSSVLQHALISGEGLFDKTLSPGESFSYTFNQKGTFTYHDNPYTSVGTIYVQ